MKSIERVTTEQQRPSRRGTYIASRASIPERSAAWRKLRADGWAISASWIDATGENEPDDLSELWLKIQEEVCSSERLVLYVEPEDLPLKGALVEVGMALAVGIKVFVVTPGITMHRETGRPLGSWAFHPNVRLVPDMETALKGACRRPTWLEWLATKTRHYITKLKIGAESVTQTIRR